MLVLKEVLNTHDSTFENHDIPHDLSSIMNYVYRNRNSSLAVGAALYTAFSNVSIVSIDGLDTYTKTWLQLAFPVYIISLVIIIITVSKYSPRFAGLIGKRDSIATLATLILLSYAKLLSVTITASSFIVFDYPDGTQETV